MLDIKFVRENIELVKKSIRDRGYLLYDESESLDSSDEKLQNALDFSQFIEQEEKRRKRRR